MNLANLSQEEKDKVNVDLAASGVAYKERLNIPVVASEVERQQPAHLMAFHVRCRRPPVLYKWLLRHIDHEVCIFLCN